MVGPLTVRVHAVTIQAFSVRFDVVVNRIFSPFRFTTCWWLIYGGSQVSGQSCLFSGFVLPIRCCTVLVVVRGVVG